ncbi:hypothetical protein AYI68_g1441 [Smittium mucronatum]|uniref:Uncharacterized protein n=1 Tax=Smittium mucronatum TaxID=133383 RepID=A0A1R0H5D6_9FUNG|nr:hypothetical protein AYI68_g1441 [Smittium mucronatum]
MKKKKAYKKDYCSNYNKLLCQTTGCVSTGKGCNIPTERPPPPSALLQLLEAEIRLTVERWTCALDYVSAVLNDQFLLFRDGPHLSVYLEKYNNKPLKHGKEFHS